MQTEVIIAGGGIIGLYTAYYLVSRDVKVTVIDRGSFGRGSSWAAGGILTPLLPWDYTPAVTDLTNDAASRYTDLSAELRTSTGIDTEFWRCGLEVLQSDQYSNAKHWCQQHTVSTSTTDVPSKNPRVHELHGSFNGLSLPRVAQIRSPRLLQALSAHLATCGVNMISDTEIVECVIENDQVTGVRTPHARIQTDKLVWATGAWAGQIQSTHPYVTLPKVDPVRGQMIAFDGKSVGLDTIIYNAGHYLIPRKDGLILAGSTLEHVGFDQSVTAAALLELQQKSLLLLPQLAACKITHQWSGLRPASNENIPTIGPHPHIKGLYFNCGHFRYGVAMAPKSAEIITDWIVPQDHQAPNATYRLTDTPIRVTE